MKHTLKDKPITEKITILADRTVNGIVILLVLIILLVSGYSIADNLYVYQSAEDNSLLAYKPDLDIPLKLYETHGNTASAEEEDKMDFTTGLPGQVAWITVYDTNIDYPVMQGVDNYEYINKNPYGEFQLSGSIFLDYRNSHDFSDTYNLIYGHHIEHGKMFGTLDDFTDEEYLKSHGSGRLVTGYHVYDIELFAVCYTDGLNPEVFHPQGHTIEKTLEYLKKNSVVYKNGVSGNKIIALTTCYGEDVNSRLAVFGMLRERNSKDTD